VKTLFERYIKGPILFALQYALSFLEGKSGGAVVTGAAGAAKQAAGSHCVNVVIAASGFSVTISPLVMIAAGAAAYVVFRYIRKQIKTGRVSEMSAELLALATEGVTAVQAGLAAILGREACSAFSV
jgi:hypothetical protein